MKKLMNILVLITCIYSQIDVNISDCDEQEINNIPTLSANLKPEFQPSWDNAQFTDLLNELRIPSLRWPGAVGSNYFDWEKGRILPCYKWNTTPCSGDGTGSGETQFGDFNQYCDNNCARDYQVQYFNGDINGNGSINRHDNVNDNTWSWHFNQVTANDGVTSDEIDENINPYLWGYSNPFTLYGWNDVIQPVTDSEWFAAQNYLTGYNNPSAYQSGVITSGCDLPLNHLYLINGDVLYNSNITIGGFQFTVDGTTVSSAGGGDAAANGFHIAINSSNIIAHSFTSSTISAGCGTLTNLVLDGTATGLSNIIVADSDINSVPFTYWDDDGGNGIMTAYTELNNFPILLADNGRCSDRRNMNSNTASDYLSGWEDGYSSTPFFVLNVYSPAYLDPSSSSTWDADDDCVIDDINLVDDDHVYNSIIDQLKDIEDATIGVSEYYIQLGNEPWHTFENDENAFPCARAYIEKMIEIAYLIRGYHPQSLDAGITTTTFSNAKLGLFGDVHTAAIPGDDLCHDFHDLDPDEWLDLEEYTANPEGAIPSWECDVDWAPGASNIVNGFLSRDKRCHWNYAIKMYLDPLSQSALFDAVSFHKYYGIADMRIPCNPPHNCSISEYNDQWYCELNGFVWYQDLNFSCNDPSYKSVTVNNLPWGWTPNSAPISAPDMDNYGSSWNGSPTAEHFYKLDYFVKWLALSTDMVLDQWNGAYNSFDINNGQHSDEGDDWSDGLYGTLPSGYDIWITEYDFEPNSQSQHWVGTWPHALAFLYKTLRYMEDVPNIDLISPNNLIGYGGSFRLLDSYMYPQSGGDELISCYYDATEGCDQIFTGLSPKGKAMKLLNQLIIDEGNTTIKRLVFNQLEDIIIKRKNTINLSGSLQDIFQTENLKGWEFGNGDYLIMNLSSEYYDLAFDDQYYWEYTSMYSNNLFAKNYHNPNATDLAGGDGINDVLWEFTSVPTDLTEYFAASNSISEEADNFANCGYVRIKPYSITKIIQDGTTEQSQDNNGDISQDGNTNVTDVIMLVAYIVDDSMLDIDLGNNASLDINGNGCINVSDVITVVNIILTGP